MQVRKFFITPDSTPASYYRWLVLFALLNALISAGLSFTLCNWPDNVWSGIYLCVAMLINFVMWSGVIALPLALLALLKIPTKICRLISLTIYVIALILVLINLKVFSLYHFHLNGMVLNLVFSGALFENLAFSTSMWLSVIASLAGLTIFAAAIYGLSLKLAQNWYTPLSLIITTMIVAIIGLQLFTGTADAFGWKNHIAQHRYIPWMQVTTMRSKLKKLGFQVVEPTNETLLEEQADTINYPLEELNCSAKSNHNILFLIVDSLRADMLTAEVMPFTYHLKNKALVYNNHYSNGNATRYGMFSLFYGLPGNYWKAMLTTERGSVLFDQTIAQDYAHFIYGSSTLTFPEFDRTIFSRLRDELHQGSNDNSAANDQEINQQLINKIQQRNNKQAFFGFAFYDSPHAFSLPADFTGPFNPRLEQVNYMEFHQDYDPTPFLNLYKSTALFVDGLIQDVFDKLQEQALLDNTIVIITSDHGQEFNETGNNTWGHNSNFSQWQTKVPLIIHWPGKEHSDIQELTSHEDLVPTLLQEVFGCTTQTEKYTTGINLLSTIPQSRSLLFESWTDRAILFNNKIFLVSHYGDIDAVDLNYVALDHEEIPAQVVTENLERMSRFVKRDH